jgi:large subunit ribosomal protein L18
MTIYKTNFDRRKQRVRRKLRATSGGALRLSVYKSNSHIYAQIIDDKLGNTLVSASTLDKEVIAKLGKRVANIDAAKLVGETIAKRAIDRGVNRVVFDRGGYKYHGKVKAIADAVRDAGVKL